MEGDENHEVGLLLHLLLQNYCNVAQVHHQMLLYLWEFLTVERK